MLEALGPDGVLTLAILGAILVKPVRKKIKEHVGIFIRAWWKWRKKTGWQGVPGDIAMSASFLSALSGLPVLWFSGFFVCAAALWSHAAWRLRHPVLTENSGITPRGPEKSLMKALEQWDKRAGDRGLGGTEMSQVRLTRAGITAQVRLSGEWTVEKLDKHASQVGAALGLPDDIPLEIGPGGRYGRATLALRTRRATDGIDMTWAPYRPGFGLDTVTGEPVDLDWRNRVLVAGTSGAGKSVFLRPKIASVLPDPCVRVVYIDLKRAEGALWRERGVMVAVTPEEVRDMVAFLVREHETRTAEMEGKSAKWKPTPERPAYWVIVDEGAEIMSLVPDALPGLSTLARMARATEEHLWWCTQKPTMSGKGAGIDSQIAGNCDIQICLKTKTPLEARTVLGEDATAEGWHANRLPKPGHALIRGTDRGPVAVKGWFLDDPDIKTVPSVHTTSGVVVRPVVSLNKTTDSLVPSDIAPWLVVSRPATDTGSVSVADCVEAVLRDATEPLGVREIARECGKNQGNVSKTLRKLESMSKVEQMDDGKWSLLTMSTP